MNRKLLSRLIPVIPVAIAIPLFALIHLADVTSLVVRTVAGAELKGITLEYGYIAQGLRQSPFILPFSHSISKFSRGALDLDVINTYTVGSYEKDKGSRNGLRRNGRANDYSLKVRKI